MCLLKLNSNIPPHPPLATVWVPMEEVHGEPDHTVLANYETLPETPIQHPLGIPHWKDTTQQGQGDGLKEDCTGLCWVPVSITVTIQSSEDLWVWSNISPTPMERSLTKKKKASALSRGKRPYILMSPQILTSSKWRTAMTQQRFLFMRDSPHLP